MKINCMVLVVYIVLLFAFLVSGVKKVQEAILGTAATIKCKYDGELSGNAIVLLLVSTKDGKEKENRIGFSSHVSHVLKKNREGPGFEYLKKHKENIQVSQVSNRSFELIVQKTTLTEEGFGMVCKAYSDGGMGAEQWADKTVLQIVESPKVSMTPSEKEIRRALNNDKDIVMKCSATGRPKPTLKWMREGKDMDGKTLEDGSLELRLKSPVTLEYDGNYVCKANVDSEKLRSQRQNEATQKVRVSVLYKPTLKIEKGTIYTDLNRKESVNIDVSGNPMPKLNCSVLRLPEPKRIRVTPYSTHNRLVYNVTILQVKQTDIHDYPCIATNSQGSANATVRLTLRPSAPEILSSNVSSYSDYYQLHWRVKSRAPMHNVTVEIHVRSGNVTKLVRTDTIKLTDNDGGIFRNHIANLSEDTMHELRIKACNSRGCGPPKTAYSFRTQAYDGYNTVDPNIVKVPVTVAPTRRGKVIGGPNGMASTLRPFTGCLIAISGILVTLAMH